MTKLLRKASAAPGRLVPERWFRQMGPRGRRALAGPLAALGLAMAVFSLLAWTGTAQASGAGSAVPGSSTTSVESPVPAARHSSKAPAARQFSNRPAIETQHIPVTKGALPNEAVSTDPKVIAAGATLFDEHCSACHGISALGTSRAPELYDVGAAAIDFYLSTGRMPLNYPEDEAMRHTPYFNEAQISQITAYVNHLGLVHATPGPGIPTVLPLCRGSQLRNCTTLAEGQQLFLMNCAQCHDATGAGGMLSKGYVIPSLYRATATEVAEAIRVGPRPMPNFGPGQLSDQQVSAVANYVRYLGTPDNAGGLPIAHFGPVPEGFTAIVIGLGSLLVLSRLIGTRG